VSEPRQSRPVVLLNVMDLSNNPFAELWRQAIESGGARVRPLTMRSVLGTGFERGGPGAVLNLQWPEWTLLGERPEVAKNVGKLFSTVLLARCLGMRVLLTVHNTRGHAVRRPRLQRIFWTALVRTATHIHFFSSAARAEFKDFVPGAAAKPFLVMPHGDYKPVIGPVPSREHARDGLGLPQAARVTTVFGNLSAYKGLDTLLSAFAAGASRQDVLQVCGKPADRETMDLLDDIMGRDLRVRVTPRFLEQTELTAAIAASDLVVLPYRRITNSGSALLALSVGRPVLLPRTDVFRDLSERVGERWITRYDGALGWSNVEEAVRAAPSDGVPDLTWCSWTEVSRLWRAFLTASSPRTTLDGSECIGVPAP
jgi:beta-1,4-mannosyltransferase